IAIFLCIVGLAMAVGYTDWQQGATEGLNIGFKMGQAYEQAQKGINIIGFNAQVDVYNAWVREHFGEDPMLLMQKLNAPTELINAVSENAGDGYLANLDTKVYHYPSCAWAQKILPENRIWFSSPDEAISAGYMPSEKCNPPGSGSSTSITSNSNNNDWGAVGAGKMGRPATWQYK
ncbi:MAG: hypothetical protein NTV30_08745, partial [Chloroflexi bacterium]|nr:hypothetical protein [Chloroflexota bacterium]